MAETRVTGARVTGARVTVLGCGSWGTALAQHLSINGAEVILWGRDVNVLEAIQKEQLNPRYFPDIKLKTKIHTEIDPKKAVESAELLVFSVPSSAMREVARFVKASTPTSALIVNTAKGLEESSLKPMTEVLSEEFSRPELVGVLSGPSFSREVLLGLPTAVTVACTSLPTAKNIAQVFHADNFRVYTSTDVVGVEFGGVLKNIIALAVGIVDGMAMGSNARAALITRGLAEMQRLIVALGGEPITVLGLSGVGDLVLTATGHLSRNRHVGECLGRGEKLPEILNNLGQVAEAVITAPKIIALAAKYGVDLPIMREVNHVLLGQSSVAESMKRLIERVPMVEF